MALRVFGRERATPSTDLALAAPCDFVAIDFETANEKRGSACAVGVTVVRGGDIVDPGSTLINPQMPFNPYCTAVNGIDEGSVTNAPTFPAIWPAHEILDAVGLSLVMVYWPLVRLLVRESRHRRVTCRGAVARFAD